MHINTDISPIISPKSNNTNSFISPRDGVVLTYDSNSNETFTPIQGNEGTREIIANNFSCNSNNGIMYTINTPENNDSYSFEKPSFNELQNKIPRTSVEDKNTVQKLEMIEYEEVNPDNEHSFAKIEHLNTPKANILIVDGNQHKNPIEKPDSDPDRILYAANSKPVSKDLFADNSNNKNKDLPTIKNQAKPKCTISIPGEEFQKPSRNQSSSEVISLPFQGFSKSKKEEKNMNAALNIETPHKVNGSKEKNWNLMVPEQNVLNQYQKNSNIENLTQEIKDLKIRLGNKTEELSRYLLLLKDKEAKERLLNDEIQGLGQKYGELLQKYELDQKKITENAELIKKIDELDHENALLKAELIKSQDMIKFLETENFSIKEKNQTNNEITKKLEKTISKLEITNQELEKTFQTRETEMKLFSDLKLKYKIKKQNLKQIQKNQEEQILNLKKKIEEISLNNHSDLYALANEKVKIYKEKISQLAKQIDTQLELIKDKENHIENLLMKLDNLAISNKVKADEISSLRNQVNMLKDELYDLRNGKVSSPNKHILNKYTEIGINGEYSSPKIETKNYQRNLFEEVNMAKSPSVNRHLTATKKSTEESNTKNLVNTQRYEHQNVFTTENEILSKKSREKNIDFDSLNKKKNERELQNLEDLQKRLAQLKTKRMEFEKNKLFNDSAKDPLLKKREDISTSSHSLLHQAQLQINMGSLSTLFSKEKESKIESSSNENTNIKDKESLFRSRYGKTPENDVLFKTEQFDRSDEILTPSKKPFLKNSIKKFFKGDTTSPSSNLVKTEVFSGKSSNRYMAMIQTIQNNKLDDLLNGHRKSQGDISLKAEDYFKFTASPRTILDKALNEKIQSNKKD